MATPIIIFVNSESDISGFLPMASNPLPKRYPSPMAVPIIDVIIMLFAINLADSISIYCYVIFTILIITNKPAIAKEHRAAGLIVGIVKIMLLLILLFIFSLLKLFLL